MARNCIQPDGDVLQLAAPYNRTSGQGALIGSLFGVALGDVLNGIVGAFKTQGVFTLAKNNAEAWTVGEKLYWDDAAKVVTATAGGNTLIGVAYAIAANPSATGAVRLNGSFS